ncbi:hypothetical protein [Ralstonia phage RSP15]|uniref:hypothetical protein n=1 Tax=Ralstonia phage RSP15 TaxID=1785960 RepID=UPI00074D369D|nr:hypothetical protein BH754_gp209 [Ralstonia phage RSP15]BAU40097.1 hypothetical protein [Ralstonia phage RSP15]
MDYKNASIYQSMLTWENQYKLYKDASAHRCYTRAIFAVIGYLEALYDNAEPKDQDAIVAEIDIYTDLLAKIDKEFYGNV